ncbi:SAM-dependent methyltransferase [Phytohabitans kaempferiae]|uniref:SAM-dependent methyltransferase n=1 Tax=Phytohabitans kaempferiae TaxID=1620943 RepID=A0ABV6MBK8_9ACTN
MTNDQRANPAPELPSWAAGANIADASSARMYDYYLGGYHNFPADQEAAQRVIAATPTIPALARVNRAMLRRVVAYLVGEVGIRQFLDIGSGIPTERNVHQVAQETAVGTRTAYVDADTVAVMHGREILRDNDGAIALRGDLREPHAILDNPQLRKLLNLDEPVAVLLFAVLPFLPGDEAYEAVAAIRDVLAPGSYIAITHVVPDGFEGSGVQTSLQVYRQRTTTPAGLRTRDEILRFFDGFHLVDPGLVWVTEWRPASDDPRDFSDDPASSSMLAGVGRLASN